MGVQSRDLLDQTLNHGLGSGLNLVLEVRELDRGQSSPVGSTTLEGRAGIESRQCISCRQPGWHRHQEASVCPMLALPDDPKLILCYRPNLKCT